MSRNVILARGPLTDLLATYFKAALDGIALVGDGERPEHSGWPAEPGEPAEPGDGPAYAPYVILGTGDAVLRETAPPVGQAMASWACGYTVEHYGAARSQCDDLADTTRAAAVGYARREVQLGEHWWQVSAVRYSRLGAVNRVDAENPPVWTCKDLFAVWLDLMRRPVEP